MSEEGKFVPGVSDVIGEAIWEVIKPIYEAREKDLYEARKKEEVGRMTQTETPTIRIDPEFEKLLPGLANSELRHLEDSLIEEGCRDPLILWGDVLVDGHHRYAICTKHGIRFDTTRMEFEDKNAAKAWILKNQLARRNVAEYLRTRYALQLRALIEPTVYLNKGGRPNHLEKPSQRVGKVSDDKNNRSVQGRIAGAAGVSHETVRKVEAIEKKADQETKDKLAGGELSITKAYRQAVKGLKEPEPAEDFEATRIKSIDQARFVVQDDALKTTTLSRADLLKKHGFEVCPHCDGYGVTKKGDG